MTVNRSITWPIGSSSMPKHLAAYTTLRLGGPAQGWTKVADEDALVEAVRTTGEEILILGGGSNIVVADAGFAGSVVHVATRGITHEEIDGKSLLTVQAGEQWDDFVVHAIVKGLAGVECLSGIPGTVGAAPIQNIGAYGQDLAETLISVRAFDRRRDEIVELDAEACEFDYRTSRFKREPDRFVVLSVGLALHPGDRSQPIEYEELAEKLGILPGETAPPVEIRKAVLALRRAKGMVLDPADPDTTSTGSFFMNPILSPEEFAELSTRVAARYGPKIRVPHNPVDGGSIKVHAAWLIERAGFSKGYGGQTTIAISSKHALAITNRGEGTTAQVVSLAQEIAAKVKRTFGISLTPEPTFIGHHWEPPTV